MGSGRGVVRRLLRQRHPVLRAPSAEPAVPDVPNVCKDTVLATRSQSRNREPAVPEGLWIPLAAK
jgi:hypothetical protein